MPIVSYFTGVTDNNDQIDIQMRSQTLLSRNELKMGAKVGGGHPGSKMIPEDSKNHASKGYSSKGQDQFIRKRDLKMNEKLQELIEKEKKMSVNDFLNEREKELSDRHSVLQSSGFNFLKVL